MENGREYGFDFAEHSKLHDLLKGFSYKCYLISSGDCKYLANEKNMIGLLGKKCCKRKFFNHIAGVQFSDECFYKKVNNSFLIK